MVSKKKTQEYSNRINEALLILTEVSEDKGTPRNIRRASKNAMASLQDKYSPAVRASNAVSIIDEILQDPNMPPYTRVKLWNVMSNLASIRD